jgi:two-component system OmpR family response regulator
VRILVVDASEGDMTTLRAQLEAHGDTVIGASEEGVDDASSTPDLEPDLVVIVRDAWTTADTELCRRLSARGRVTPILALSAACDGRQRALALRAGADDFLSMPFEHEEFVARASALARRVASRYARAGAFLVDFRRRKVFVGSHPVTLTPHEYDLFVALVERIGEVVSREELADRIDQAGGKSNVVDVHMSRIRAKLGANASRLEAVRGRGYRLR